LEVELRSLTDQLASRSSATLRRLCRECHHGKGKNGYERRQSQVRCCSHAIDYFKKREQAANISDERATLRKALAFAEKSFEPVHPSIARSQSNLALVLKDLGQLEEACDLLRKAYSASLERYGTDHPHTKTFKGNLEGLTGE
jgi:tetratricopeptide (TPR) repeat protein